jgi:site-specific DNA-methyltransferase (adenine-specific)
MAKAWDNNTGAVETWQECFRVLKPGGHILAFSASRTYHHLATNIESVGFEIRDQIMWLYGSGFPKSYNIGKAMDKLQGKKREVVGKREHPTLKDKSKIYRQSNTQYHSGNTIKDEWDVTAPATDEAKQWEGWGTALKPAHEPIVMARKPLSENTVAENVLKHGTGGINIDESRVDGLPPSRPQPKFGVKEPERYNFATGEGRIGEMSNPENKGRFPANIIHDGSEEVLEGFPETGKSAGGRSYQNTNKMYEGGWDGGEGSKIDPGFGDSGSAARFFYCAKVSRTERHIGFEQTQANKRPRGEAFGANQREDGNLLTVSTKSLGNNHPTVKPVALMKYLITLITPKGGKVLDPFNGSGSTGMACVELGYEYTGCELDPDYIEISKARIEAWYAENKPEEVNEYFDKI